MKKRISILLTMIMTIGMLSCAPALAVDCSNPSSPKEAAECGLGSDKDESLMPTILTVINLLIGITGVIAVVVIVIGGLQYTTSTGDAAKVTKAKNTIMYGIIGLVVAMLAFAIVNFVLGNAFS